MTPVTVGKWMHGCLRRAIWAALILSIIAGCQHPDNQYGQADAESREWRQTALETHAQPIPMPPPQPDPDEAGIVRIPATTAVEAEVSRPRPALPDVPVEHLIMTEEADLAVFLRALAKGAQVNLLIGEHVSGPIRLTLPQATGWDTLFQMVVQAHGLHYEWHGQLLRVLAREDIERQIAIERSLKDRELARELRKQSEPLELGLYRVRYADTGRLAESLRSGLAQLMGPEGVFTVIPDEDSGLVILHAPPSRMEQVMRLAQNLDQPAYQVLIEATIVQTNSETARDLGFQWGAFYPGRNSGTTQLGTAVSPDGWNMNFPAGFSGAEAGFSFGAIRETSNQILQAQLTALQKDGRLRIISTPSITTLDKQLAKIESGEERPFQSASGTGATTTPTVEFKKALLTLEVTPQVIDGRWIKLSINTTKDDFDDSRAVIIDGRLQVPIITRGANTTLYLADGQTTVIGGLSTQSDNDGESGIPFLKDIPFFGNLFRNTTNRTSFNDTLIFITPQILPGRVATGLEPLPLEDAR